MCIAHGHGRPLSPQVPGQTCWGRTRGGGSPGCWPSVRRVLRHAWDRAQSSYSLKGRPSLVRRSCRETPWGWGSHIQGAGTWEGLTGQRPPPTRCVRPFPRMTGRGSPRIRTTGMGASGQSRSLFTASGNTKHAQVWTPHGGPSEKQTRNHHLLQQASLKV